MGVQFKLHEDIKIGFKDTRNENRTKKKVYIYLVKKKGTVK